MDATPKLPRKQGLLLTDTNGSTLETMRQERAARAETETPASDRTRVLNAIARSAPVRNLARAFSFGAFGLLLATLALVAVATVPSLFGYHSYTIEGGSMEPTLSVGDAAVTKPSSPRSLEIGDVIVRRDTQGGRPVLHRIVEVVSVDGQLAFITQGDQNNAPDIEPVVLAGPGDKVIYSVPYVGYILNFAETWYGRLFLIGLPLVLLSSLFIGGVQRFIPARKDVSAPTHKPVPASASALAMTPALLGANTRVEQRDRRALRRFALRHNGVAGDTRQCTEHPSMSGMTTLEVLAALRQETGLVATSQRIAETCAELGVPFARVASATEEGFAKRAA